MKRPWRYDMPTREAFARMYYDRSLTVEDIARFYGVSVTLVCAWAQRFGLIPRSKNAGKPMPKAAPPRLSARDNHCRDLGDGPGKGDPTPLEIAERAKALRLAHLRQRQASEA